MKNRKSARNSKSIPKAPKIQKYPEMYSTEIFNKFTKEKVTIEKIIMPDGTMFYTQLHIPIFRWKKSDKLRMEDICLGDSLEFLEWVINTDYVHFNDRILRKSLLNCKNTVFIGEIR